MKHALNRRLTASGLALRLTMASAILALSACGGGGGSGSAGTTGPNPPQNSSYAGPVTVAIPSDGREYWMAYQDGDGAWALAQKTSTGFTFQVSNTAGKYGLVMVSEDPSGRSDQGPRVTSLFFTRQEVPTVDLTFPTRPAASVFLTIDGAPTGSGAPTSCFLGIGSSLRSLGYCAASASDNVFVNTYAGTVDTFLTHLDAAGQADLFLAQRDVAVSDKARLNFDFTTASRLSATQPSRLINEVPVAGETFSYSATYVSSSSRAWISHSSQSSLSYPLIPDALRRPTDYYSVGLTASADQNGAYARRFGGYRSLSGKGQDVQLPSYVKPIEVGLVPGASAPRPALRWTPLKGSLMSDLEVFSYTPSQPWWFATFSSGWMGGQAQMSYNFPDLSSLGWKSSWYLVDSGDLYMFYLEQATSNPDKGFYIYKPQREKLVDEVNWASDISAPLFLH